jgi:hypothetical protein
MARLAPSEAEARAWREAGKRGDLDGLERLVAVPTERVVARQRVVVPDAPVEPAPGLPASVRTGLRLLAAPPVHPTGFAGSATVLPSAAGPERLALDLGLERPLTVDLRIAGQPLATDPGEVVEVDYRRSDEPSPTREIVGIVAPSGDRYLSALEVGRAPVGIEVPLFDLKARQVMPKEPPSEDDASLPVRVQVGPEKRVMEEGEVATFSGGLRVRVLLSLRDLSPGAPAVLRLQAWTEE